MFTDVRDRQRAALTVILCVSVGAAAAAIYYPPILADQYGDLGVHVSAAAEMSAKRVILVPHFFFHLLTILLASSTGTALLSAGVALAAAAQGLTCLLLIAILGYGNQTLGLSRPVGRETALLAGFALSFVGPLSLFSYPNLYLGYPGISVAHSPTVILLRPAALALFIVTLRLLASRSWSQWTRLAAVAATLVLVGGLTKPSYNVCLAPALALMVVLPFRREGSLPKISRATCALIVFSVTAITLWQVAFTYGPGADAGVTIAPLKVMAFWNHGSRGLTVIRIGLGLVFPIFVAVAYRKAAACSSDAFRLSWLAALVAIGSGCLLAETGRREMQGNLLWSMQVCLLILMTTSLAVFLSEEDAFHRGESAVVTKRTLVGAVLFLLHFMSGLIYVISGPRVS